MNLQIKCPTCVQRFQIEDKFEGKMVECGACETRFKIDDEVIIREKKRIYPGENKNQFLDRISRSPAARKEQPVSFQTAAYSQHVNADAMLPASAGQNAATAVGGGVLVFSALFFLFGSAVDGPLQDVDLTKRIILGGFSGFIGGALLIFGAKNWRLGGIVLALALIGVIAALIMFQPVHKSPSGSSSGSIFDGSSESATATPLTPEVKIAQFKKRVGYEQVQREIDSASDSEGVVGFYFSSFEERFKPILESYFSSKLKLSKTQIPGTYRREDGRAFLMVYAGLTMSFDAVVSHCDGLGAVTTYPEEQLIEVQLNSSHFKEPTQELYQTLTDPQHQDFSRANLIELRHIDYQRAKSAVERIDLVPESVRLSHKPEVIKELIRLLAENQDADLDSSIGAALTTWSGKDPAVAEKVGEIVASRLEGETATFLVNYLIAAKASQVPVIIDSLWARSPLSWSEQYEALGSSAESRLLFHLKNSPLALKKSAAEILRKVGTQKSLTPLRSAKNGGGIDFKITLDRAIEAIKNRQ